MDEYERTPQNLIRAGVMTYASALLLIALFSFASHSITNSIVNQQKETARLIELGTGQRMLSQRIAVLALERTVHAPLGPDRQIDEALLQSISTMESAHQDLLRALPDSAAASSLRDIYLGEPVQLDSQMKDFLLRGRILATRPPAKLALSNPDLRILEQAAHKPLPDALEAAVQATGQSGAGAIDHLRHVLSVLTLVLLVVLCLEAVFLYLPLWIGLSRAHSGLIEAGRTDPLTGCLNRRAFSGEAKRLLLDAREHGDGQLSVLMLDIDKFKSINDRFGHATGDIVIKSVVSTLLHHVAKHHIVCRMGGEEFAVVLPKDSLDQATETAEMLRRAVAAMPVPLPAPITLNADVHTSVPVTVSIGASDLQYSDNSLFVVLGRADKAVYRAKHNGRNRVEVEPGGLSTDRDFVYPRRSRI